MTPKELQRWMSKKDWSAVSVAGATAISLSTITRFLHGETEKLHPINVKALRALVARADIPDADPKTVL